MYIIPRPQQWYQKEGTFTLKYDRRIVLNSNCPPEVYEDAQMLQQDLEEYAGFVQLSVVESQKTGTFVYSWAST